jgi:hypothetical protein
MRLMSEERIPVNRLLSEDGAHELATSEDMKPYLDYLTTELQGKDTTAARDAIAALPLEERYTWRVLSALKWAFADLEAEYMKLDCETLPMSDLGRVSELIRLRPIQFCIFIRALVGSDEMKRIMLKAINAAME